MGTFRARPVGEAVTVLDGLSDTASFATFRYYHTALVHDAAGDVEGAEAAYDLALKSPGPTPLRLVQAYGSFLERHGRGEEARDLYHDLLQRTPGSTALSATFDRYTAGEEARLLVKNAPEGTAEALYGVAGVLFREGAYSAALFYVRLAINLRPDLDEAQLLIGDILDATSQPAQAIDAYRVISEQSPFHEPATIKIAQNLDRLDRTDEATRPAAPSGPAIRQRRAIDHAGRTVAWARALARGGRRLQPGAGADIDHRAPALDVVLCPWHLLRTRG